MSLGTEQAREDFKNPALVTPSDAHVVDDAPRLQRWVALNFVVFGEVGKGPRTFGQGIE